MTSDNAPQSGTLDDGSRPTIAHVARAAGVSVTTAARVLSGQGYASRNARDRVKVAAESLGYVPNLVARSLRHGRTPTIGLLVADVENSFYAAIAKNVESVASTSGYSVVLCNSNDDPARERQMLDLLESIRIAGLILTPTGANRRQLLRIQRAGIPIVQVDRVAPHLAADAVLVDNEAGAYDAVVTLIEAGHRRIGILAGRAEVTTGSERTEGYLRALREHNIEVEPGLIRGGSFVREHALEEARALISQDPRPTAVFAANNILAEACLLAIKDAGLHVPTDISVVAFDDVEWMRISGLGLTAVRQPIAEMSRAAAEMMLRRLRGEAATPAKLSYRPQLILRDSVAPPTAGAAGRRVRIRKQVDSAVGSVVS